MVWFVKFVKFVEDGIPLSPKRSMSMSTLARAGRGVSAVAMTAAVAPDSKARRERLGGLGAFAGLGDFALAIRHDWVSWR